jgi:uncharacterized protein
MSLETLDTPKVSGVLHLPARANGDAFALTHGAGSNRDAAPLAGLAAAFEAAGYTVLRYDLPFRRARPKGPPFPAGAARDREGVAAAVAALRARVPGRIVAGGQSYGGRQTAMAAAEQPGMAAALLLLSYPLHPPHRPERPRTDFFPALRTPVLFVHGSADPFASREELRAAAALISAPAEILEVERAGHDLKGAAALAGAMLERLAALL